MDNVSELMATLSDNYKIGIGVLTGIVVVIYILISVFSIKRVYKVKGKITAWGMIPVVHLFLFLSGVSLPEKKENSKKKEAKPVLNNASNADIDPNDIPLDDIGDIF